MCIAVHAAVILRSSAPICTPQVCSLMLRLAHLQAGHRQGDRAAEGDSVCGVQIPGQRCQGQRTGPVRIPPISVTRLAWNFCSAAACAWPSGTGNVSQRPSPAVAVSPVFFLQFDLRVPMLPKSPRLEEIAALAIVQGWRGTRHHGGRPQGAGGPRGGGTLQPSKGDCPSVMSTSHLQGRRDARHCGDGPQGSGGPHSGGISQL